MKIWMRRLMFLSALLAAYPAQAAVESSRVTLDAMDTLVRSFAKDAAKSKKTFGRTSLFITLSDDFDTDTKNYLQKKMEAALLKYRAAEVVPCFQCDSLRAHSDGNRVVVEKGLNNNEIASKIARELSLDTFLDINVGYSGKKIYLQAKAIDTAKNEIVWNESYEQYARFLNNKGFTMSLEVGPSYTLSAQNNEEKFGLGIAGFLGERFYGFGKVGLGASSLVSFGDGKFSQSTGPYIGVNLNEALGKNWSWGDVSLFVNPGYAVSQKSIGFLMRGGVEVGLGNFTHVSVEYQKSIYNQNPNKSYPESVVLMVGYDFF